MPASAAISSTSVSGSVPTVPSTMPAMPSTAPTVSVPVVTVPATPGAAIAQKAAGPVTRPVELIAVDRVICRRLFICWRPGTAAG
jgi:hypothetical protein